MKVSVEFEVEETTHELTKFQADGHFVPGMTDEEQRRRPWKGETVHTLELKHNGLQVLRVVADSPDEAARLMRRNIVDTLFALWTAQKQTEFSYDQMKRLVDRVAVMQEFIDHKMKPTQAPERSFADVFEAAMYYMDREAPRQ